MRILETMYVILSHMCVTRLGEISFLAYVNIGILVLLINNYKYYAHDLDENSHSLASAARE